MSKASYSFIIAATLALGFSGAARAADCGEQPKPPAIPNGATSKADDLNKVSKAMEAYSVGFDKWQQCVSDMLEKSVKEYDSTLKIYQQEVAAFKAGAGKK